MYIYGFKPTDYVKQTKMFKDIVEKRVDIHTALNYLKDEFDIDVAELAYWRKHPNLHGYMHNLYKELGGTASQFNLERGNYEQRIQ